MLTPIELPQNNSLPYALASQRQDMGSWGLVAASGGVRRKETYLPTGLGRHAVRFMTRRNHRSISRKRECQLVTLYRKINELATQHQPAAPAAILNGSCQV